MIFSIFKAFEDNFGSVHNVTEVDEYDGEIHSGLFFP